MLVLPEGLFGLGDHSVEFVGEVNLVCLTSRDLFASSGGVLRSSGSVDRPFLVIELENTLSRVVGSALLLFLVSF